MRTIPRATVLDAMFEAGIPRRALVDLDAAGFGFEVRRDALSDAVEFLAAVALVADQETAHALAEGMRHDLSGPRLRVWFDEWELT